MRTYRPVFGTYRLVAESTAQAMRVAETYRKRGWRCTTRGRRLVLTTHQREFLEPDTPGELWQLDRSAHEVACREWLVPELRGGRRRSGETPLPEDEAHSTITPQRTETEDGDAAGASEREDDDDDLEAAVRPRYGSQE